MQAALPIGPWSSPEAILLRRPAPSAVGGQAYWTKVLVGIGPWSWWEGGIARTSLSPWETPHAPLTEGVPFMSQLTEFFARHVRRLLLLAIAMAALVLGPQPAPAQDAGNSASPGSIGPLTLVESSVSRVMALVKSQPDTDQRRAAVREVAATLFDFNEMAR